MSALPYTLSFPSLGCIVVHAGLVPGVDLQDQDANAMSCMRNVVEVEGGEGYKALVLPTEGIVLFLVVFVVFYDAHGFEDNTTGAVLCFLFFCCRSSSSVVKCVFIFPVFIRRAR